MHLVTERPAYAQGVAHTHSATHTYSNVRVTTAASETEGVAAVSWIESLMIRRPLGSIDPNSIRVSELHTECRRTVGRTWCGGEMSISNAMLLRFTSGVPYGFRVRQRFELVPKALSSQIKAVFERIREQYSQGRTSPTGLARHREE